MTPVSNSSTPTSLINPNSKKTNSSKISTNSLENISQREDSADKVTACSPYQEKTSTESTENSLFRPRKTNKDPKKVSNTKKSEK
jgi:hypothetical protein